MSSVRVNRNGFTMIEMMVAVGIVGILASIALPAFTRFMGKARTSEATTNLGALYRGSVAYYQSGSGEHYEMKLGSSANYYSNQCLPGPPAFAPSEAGDGSVPIFSDGDKMAFNFSSVRPFREVGFEPSSPVAYTYRIEPLIDVDAHGCGPLDSLAGGGVISNGDVVMGIMAFGNPYTTSVLEGWTLAVSYADGELFRSGMLPINVPD